MYCQHIKTQENEASKSTEKLKFRVSNKYTFDLWKILITCVALAKLTYYSASNLLLLGINLKMHPYWANGSTVNTFKEFRMNYLKVNLHWRKDELNGFTPSIPDRRTGALSASCYFLWWNLFPVKPSVVICLFWTKPALFSWSFFSVHG